MCAMSFPASDSIAADHPDLAEAVRTLDAHLARLGPEPFLPDRIADHVDLDPGLLLRLLHLYEICGAVEPVDGWLCPRDGSWLEPGEDGMLWCDVCTEQYNPDEFECEAAYRLVAALPLPSGQPGPRSAIRDLLLAAFTHEEFERLFRYSADPALHPVGNQFSPHDGLATMVDKAIEWCERRGLLVALLREVARVNPDQYAAHRERLYGAE